VEEVIDMISYDEALKEVKKRVPKKNLVKHMIATAAAMRAWAEYFGEDPDRWEIAGLLHDIDLGETDDINIHSIRGAEIVRDELGIDDEEIYWAIYTHNDAHGVEPKSLMGQVLRAVDPLTGLIVASTLVLPSKKIKDLKTESVIKRFKEKRFAAGANRDLIKTCENFGVDLETFIDITLKAMQGVADQIGL
jgi:putative nucleotidyltransferase with HDIG domain